MTFWTVEVGVKDGDAQLTQNINTINVGESFLIKQLSFDIVQERNKASG